jgi:hypothetical protein
VGASFLLCDAESVGWHIWINGLQLALIAKQRIDMEYVIVTFNLAFTIAINRLLLSFSNPSSFKLTIGITV